MSLRSKYRAIRVPRPSLQSAIRRSATCVACVMGVTVMLTACATGGSQGRGAPAAGSKIDPPAIPASPSAPPSVATEQNVTLPLDAYEDSPQNQAAVLDAINMLAVKCMRSRGFTFAAVPPSAQGIASEQLIEPYGVTSPAQAASYGYQTPPSSAGTSSASGQRAQHSAAYIRALWGVVPGTSVSSGEHKLPGCMPAAVDRVNPPNTSHLDLSLSGQLELQAEQYTAEDARVTKVEAAWRACMTRKGFQYPTPMAAQAAFPQTGHANQAQIATAEADVACKEQTNLPGVWLAVEAGYEKELIAGNLTGLQALMQWQNTRVSRAEKVIAASG
jgi:hypothetical protein